MIGILIVSWLITKVLIDARTDHTLAKQGIVSPRLAAKYGGEGAARNKIEKYGFFDFLTDVWRSYWHQRGEAIAAAKDATPSTPGSKVTMKDRRKAAGKVLTRVARKLIDPVGGDGTPDTESVQPAVIACIDCGDPIFSDAPGLLCPACTTRRQAAAPTPREVPDPAPAPQPAGSGPAPTPQPQPKPPPQPQAQPTPQSTPPPQPARTREEDSRAEWARHKRDIARIRAEKNPVRRMALVDIIAAHRGRSVAENALAAAENAEERERRAAEEAATEPGAERQADAQPGQESIPTPEPQHAPAGDKGDEVDRQQFEKDVQSVRTATDPMQRRAVVSRLCARRGGRWAEDVLDVACYREQRAAKPQPEPPSDPQADMQSAPTTRESAPAPGSTESTEEGTSMGNATGEAAGVVSAAEQARLIHGDVATTAENGGLSFLRLQGVVETLIASVGRMGLDNRALVVQALTNAFEALATTREKLASVTESSGVAIGVIAKDYELYMPTVVNRTITGQVASDEALSGN